ncbi:MAG: DUF2867 domain-containing protein [Xanthomonadaceae bacterium]|nr:DUF2867 domain-containing protein [Xanthomonadaceae bacterium]
MSLAAKTVQTFPSVRIPSRSGGLPVEVVLIAQLGIGAGTQLVTRTASLQRGHAAFVDAFDEPSARIGGADFALGDPSSLYTFIVGANGHPFHRHAGHRVFTAVSGSSGARLRFSTASQAQLDADPHAFLDALRDVVIPPDCLFTVRFGGGTWHQFLPGEAGSGHPALFALSCHTNELGGELAADVREQVMANEADIPSLTELLPPAVERLLERGEGARREVPTMVLSLNEQVDSLQGRFCARARDALGRLRAWLGGLRAPVGFFADTQGARVRALPAVPAYSLLARQFENFDSSREHEDIVAIDLDPADLPERTVSGVLARVLEGFLENRPSAVGRMMQVRNVLVKPLGLRTSPLGCPVSSLLGACPQTFAGRFPVLDHQVDGDDRAEVLLGADDRHLRFRSSVGVERLSDGRLRISLATRVRTRNRFGRAYMALIERTHRHYIAPTMLRMAVLHVRVVQVADVAPAPARVTVL